jgi:NAD+ synthase
VPTRWRRTPDDRWTVEPGPMTPPTEGLEAAYQAMVLGLRDYVRKNRFPGVVLGLSGGIDSALTAAVAVDALGREQVHCVMMPSPYTSAHSLEDAGEVARLLGVELRSIGIGPAMQAFAAMLAPSFAGRGADIAEENIQSRARGMTLMALSNKFGWMVLSTGNKSEMSVGYATLYGDMCGGYAVLKDVYKMTVFALARWRNQVRPEGLLGPGGTVIPLRVLTKPPSAELKPDQTDQDTLPPYDVLDAILECLIEHEMTVADIVARGHDEGTVRAVWRMLDRAEYKRRQAPPGVKITRRAFGRDRRYPITNGFQNVAPAPEVDAGETPRAPAPSVT